MNQRAPGYDWMALVRQNGTAEFGKALLRIRRLLCRRGSHRGFRRLPRPAAYMKPSSSHTRTSDGRKTYLEWQGKAFGKQVRGTTILTHNHEGLIEHIQLYHSPLPVVVEFSRELAKRLEVERRSGC